MSEEGEIWAEVRKERTAKRWDNVKQSIALLKEKGIQFVCMDKGQAHYRVGDYDFWATTGKWFHRPTKEYGRGVFKLIKRVI